MNGEEWYYGSEEAHGPVSKPALLGVLQRGDLGVDAEVLVLNEDSDKWLPVKEEPGLLFSPIESGAKFSIGEALEFGCRTYLNIVTSLRLLGRCVLLALTAILVVCIITVPSKMAMAYFLSEGNLFYGLFLGAIILFAQTVFLIAVFKVYLSICEPGTPRFNDLYSHGHLALDYLGIEILMGLLVLPASIFLLLPDFYYLPIALAVIAAGSAIYFGLVFSMGFFSMVEFETGPISSLQTSCALTKGARWRLLGWALICLPVTAAISATCMIDWWLFGVLVLLFLITAGPIIGFATVHIYRRLLHETEATELPEEAMITLGKAARLRGA
jgi:hypothetical protein